MKLTCDIVTQNRVLPTYNLKGSCRPVRATLALGKKTSSAPNLGLLICTAQNRNGNLYKVKGNVLQIFRKFVEEGKATIRFQEPAHDICLTKADPIQLKSFLYAISLSLGDKGLKSVHWSHLAPATSAQVARLPTRLKIENRKDYPAIGHAFPKSLISLTVNGCSLQRIDNRILRLQHLTVLNLSHNKLQQIPAQLNGDVLPVLASLDLSHNSLISVPSEFFQSHLKKSLTYINLNHNMLKSLPSSICDLTALLNLHVTNNELAELPHQIGRLSATLRTLQASQNLLTYLPGSVKSLRLDEVDVYGNRFTTDGLKEAVVVRNCLSLPTLVECAARTILDKRIAYEEDLPRELLHYLKRPHWCYCGKSCFDSFALFHKTIDLGDLATTVVSSTATGWTIPMQSFVCSMKCLALL